jgi:hypothetical protein
MREYAIMNRVTRFLIQALLGVSVLGATAAHAGAVSEHFSKGIFGVSWGDSRSALTGKYPAGTWKENTYCVDSKQTLMKLAAAYQTKKVCFSIGNDQTVDEIFAHFSPTLPSLLAVVNRSRTMFGDFDSIQRDDAIQSRNTVMLWSKDRPLQLRISSKNDSDGRPESIVLSVHENASPLAGVKAVNN